MRNRSEDQIRFVMIRHGATQSNKEHRYLGRTDETLSKEGREELETYRKSRCYPEVDRLFVSPMRRCIETAKILYPHLEPVCIPEWAEMDFGAFEGKNYIELKEDERYQRWIDSNGTLPFPEGESREAFIRRCEKGFRKMVRMASVPIHAEEPGRTVGMIVHGGTIMALMSRYCGGDYFSYQTANGRGYLCIATRRAWEEGEAGFWYERL